jgi:phosphoenolpyruvate carboxylase
VRDILRGYIQGMRRIWGNNVSYVRPFAARSDPAMDSGVVVADLFVLGAVSEFERFSRESGVPVFPIIGAGSCTFRGGLAPDRIDDFLSKYPGYRTATVQSAFRYDYAEPAVRDGVEQLKARMPNTEARVLDEPEMGRVNDLMDVFSAPYKATVTMRENGRMPIADTIVEIADKFIPSHRERAGHVGQFGYARSMENAVELPRAIKYCAAFMALGIPPELVGSGRGISQTRERGLLGDLERLLPFLRQDLSRALRWIDVDAVDYFAKQSEAWAQVKQDVAIVSEYTETPPGPQTAEEVRHLTHTRNFVELYKHYNGEEEIAREMTTEALKAAEIRHYLG